jgi:hypothetical protein
VQKTVEAIAVEFETVIAKALTFSLPIDLISSKLRANKGANYYVNGNNLVRLVSEHD